MTTMGFVFGGFGALRPVDRFEIGWLARRPNGFVPVFAEEFARLPVPDSPADARALVDRLSLGLMMDIHLRLADWTLAAMVPGIAGSTELIETAPSATNRILAVVRARGVRTWSDIAHQTMRDIGGWHGAGPQLTRRLVGAAIESALRAAAITTPHQLELVYTRPPVRSDTTHALDRCLADDCDPRGRVAFEVDHLRAETGNRPAAHQETHELVGLSMERTRQLRNKCRDRVVTRATAEPLVAALLPPLADRIGEATSVAGIGDVLREFELPGLHEPAGCLAVWLAGRLYPVPGFSGWLSRHPADLVAATRQVLEAGGGVHTVPSLRDDLARIGVAPDQTVAWLTAQRVRFEGEMVVSLAGSASAVVVRALEATGRAMTPAELGGWTTPPRPTSRIVELLRCNSAFVQTRPGFWELAEWGGEPCESVVFLDLIVTDGAASGDEAELPSDLADSLGLGTDGPTRFSTRFGPLALLYDGECVRRTSLRYIVLASGAAVGDVLHATLRPQQRSADITLSAGNTLNFTPTRPPDQKTPEPE